MMKSDFPITLTGITPQWIMKYKDHLLRLEGSRDRAPSDSWRSHAPRR